MNNNSSDIIKRQLLIIQLLLEGNYVSTRQIQEHLATHSIKTKLRSIQRDLLTLEDILPIECRKDDKPYSWRWQKLSNTRHNQLSLSQAIALRLVETELKGVIPTDLYDRLEPLFIKSHFVTGLSQIESIDKLTSTNMLDLEKDTNLENKKSLRASPKSSIIPASPLINLIMNLRVKLEQRKNMKKNSSELKVSNSEELDDLLEDKEKQLIERLTANLQENNLNSVAKLLTE